jgi:hypothetical protein
VVGLEEILNFQVGVFGKEDGFLFHKQGFIFGRHVWDNWR